jgi:acyl-CoA synthetase (AMP-forming)/AMP-acid ligase II
MKMNFSTISERLADTFGEREALVNIERDRRYTFTEFHMLTNRIVNMMRQKLDLRRGDHWVNILDNDNASLLHFFTAMKGEAAACYTNYRDSLEDHSYQVDTVDAKVVFLEADLLESHYEMLHSRQVTIVSMDRPEQAYPGVHYFWDLLEGVADSNPDVVHDDRSDLVILRFTGGTTGRGKCAMYSMDNWLMCRDSFFAAPDPVWSPQSRLLHLAPITHGSGMLVLPTLFKGGCTVTMNAPDLEAWCDNVAREKINTAMMVPTLLYRLLAMDESIPQRLATLETVFYGAAPMSPSKLAELQVTFGNIFIQIYGSTEHPAVALSMSKADHLVDNFDDDSHLASAGRAAPGVEIQITDEKGNPLPRGEMGEIWLRSRAISLGYFGNPEQTASEFQDGFWKSGDLGRMDDHGFVYIVDRKKDMIISGGFNVYANEVESAINSHPAVLMSAVVGIPHEEWGEAIHAEVLLKPGESAEPDELREYVKGELGGYKAPKTLQVVTDLPVSAVGKVLRRKVREKYWTDTQRKVG